jgi:hypothetical protein
MKTSNRLPGLLVLAAGALPILMHLPAHAGPVDPGMSTITVATSPAAPCHWLFALDGSRDDLVVQGTLRNSAGAPASGCLITATVVPLSGTASACPGVAVQTRISNPLGTFTPISFRNFRGCGDFRIDVTDAASALIASLGPYTMTSPDLTGDGNVNVFDLGVLADGLPPSYDECADFNCDAVVNGVDQAILASEMGTGCP